MYFNINNSFITEVSIIKKLVHSVANQLTGFYLIGTSVMKELSRYYVAKGGTIMNNAKKLYKKVYKESLRKFNCHAHSRGAFKTQSNIHDGALCKNDHFHKELRLRGCLYGDFKPEMKFQPIKP